MAAPRKKTLARPLRENIQCAVAGPQVDALGNGSTAGDHAQAGQDKLLPSRRGGTDLRFG